MAEVYAYDGTHLTIVKDGTVELSESADHGNIGSGRLTLDDEAGTTEIVGHKSMVITQSACSFTRTFTGYVGQRSYQRGESPKVLASREIDVTLLDLNARLGFKVIRGRTGKRPRETIADRLTWLLASSFLSSYVSDSGFVDYHTRTVDKNDYRGSFPADVLRDMALEVGYNYFVYWDATDGAALWFQDSNISTDFSSTLRISNVLADIDESTTFAAGADAELSRDPSQVISGNFKPYRDGRVYRTRAATAAAFEPRDGVSPGSDVKKRARAIVRADRELFARRNEEDIVTDTIVLPDDKVNLVRAGQRIQAKYSHFDTEGYGAFTWFRILETRKKPRNADAGEYDVGLTLSPQETTCGSIVQESAVIASPATVTLSALTPGNILVAIGVRSTTSAVPGIHYLGADAGFTDLGQPLEDSADGGSEGRAWIQGKIIDGTTPAGPYAFDDGGSYLWKLFELAADLSNRTTLSLANQSISGTTFTGNLGTFSSAEGVALMVECVGSTGVTAGIDTFISMGADWTEEYDGRRDPADNGSRPFVGIGSSVGDGTDIACSWAWSSSGSGNMSKWSGIAILFGC